MEFYEQGWPAYVSVAERRAQAQRKLAALQKKGTACEPVIIEGRSIANTFWGKKWCNNLESYSDYANRLPRGRSYVRNGSVIDLQITAGQITARVAGSSVYRVQMDVQALDATRWKAIQTECAGKINSLIELLQGRLSSAVMEVVTCHGSGLFPVPAEIRFRCSCPDSASMCKHVAAVLYGVGARLDSRPELLFLLRHLDPQALVQEAGNVSALSVPATPAPDQSLANTDLSALFGIDIAATTLQVTEQEIVNLIPQKPPRQRRKKRVTASDLIAQGLPRHKIQSWLKSGVLLRTDNRGVYGITSVTQGCIDAYLRERQG